MRIAAFIILLFGIFNVLAPLTGNPKDPLMLFASLLGILLIGIAMGIWKRLMFAWQWGFVAIALTPIFFVAQVCSELPAVNTNEKFLIISACSIGATLVAAYWWSVWYRQKRWFTQSMP
jgi:hypothetical protein